MLTPLFERQFLAHSYAYRKGRGPLAASDRIMFQLKRGVEHSAAGDIDNYFDSIDRSRLFGMIQKTVWEKPILRLLEIYMHMGETKRLEWVDAGSGIAQGSPVSPLLSNVYLMEFDRLLESARIPWIRFADNFLLLGPEPSGVRSVFDQAEEFLAKSLGLRLNADSRRFASHEEGFSFLGFRYHAGRRTMSPEKFDQKKAALARSGTSPAKSAIYRRKAWDGADTTGRATPLNNWRSCSSTFST
jgi:retron-type reverse transcriptase